jgi:hypothetical protein
VKKVMMAMVGLMTAFGFQYASAQEGAHPQKEWNFLIYLNGVNSLDQFGAININQMEAVGSNANLNILVQWGTQAKTSVDRLLVQKDTDPQKVTSPVVQTLPSVDMGNVKSLVDFAEWAQANYPAKHTFIVVWDHGNGWHFANIKGNFVAGNPFHANDISWDDRTGSYITTEQLGQAMVDIATNYGRKIDIYGSDACLMGMAEVAGEMKGAVQYFVGSQEVEPGMGWPYTDFLTHWSANMAMGAGDVAKTLSSDYAAAYSGGTYGKDNATMSAYDMSKIDDFNASIKQLSADLLKLPPAQLANFKATIASMKSFTNADYKDLVDMLDKGGLDNVAKFSSVGVRQATNNFVIANNENLDQMTHGLSIWLPTDQSDADTYLQRYHGLKFAQDSGWDQVVAALFKK